MKVKVCHGYVLINGIFTIKVKKDPGIQNLSRSHIKDLTINVSI